MQVKCSVVQKETFSNFNPNSVKTFAESITEHDNTEMTQNITFIWSGRVFASQLFSIKDFQLFGRSIQPGQTITVIRQF